MSEIATIVAEAFKESQPAPKKEPVKEGNPGLSGLVDNIPSMKIFGLPVGDAVKGMVVAGIGDVAVRLLVAKLPPLGGQVSTSSAIAKGLVAAGLQMRQVKGLLGANAANVGSLLLVVDAVNDLVQVRASVNKIVTKLTAGWVPGSGLLWGGRGPSPSPTPTPILTAVQQAGQVAENYYAHLGDV